MYLPNYFHQHNDELIQAFIDEHPFATLITESSGSHANHFPFLLVKQAQKLKLRSHMALANPQWKHLETHQEVLVLFQGPHAYISPTLYATEPNVPTWNYTAVHVYGFAKTFHDPENIQKILTDTVQRFEKDRIKPWDYQLPAEFQAKLVKAIVGFEIEVTRVEAKFKLSQNRSQKDYESVVKNLGHETDASSQELLKLMKLTAPKFQN